MPSIWLCIVFSADTRSASASSPAGSIASRSSSTPLEESGSDSSGNPCQPKTMTSWNLASKEERSCLLKPIDTCWESDELDYALFHLPSPNIITGPNNRIIDAKTVAMSPKQTSVLIGTGTTNMMRGSLLGNSFYTKLSESSSYQELWIVAMERNIS